MLNESLWILLLFANFLGIMLAYKFFGKTGLFCWIGVSVILANIQVLKTVQLFGFVTSLGNIIYSSIFLATDILNENYGKKEAQKAVWLGFFILLFTALFFQLTLKFIPDESDFISPAMQDLFGFFPRIMVASLTAYLISQLFDVWVFDGLRKKTKGKHLWLRNNVSTVLSQILDNTIFVSIAFVGFFGLFGWKQIFEWNVVLQIFFVSIIMKYIVAALDTIVIYWAKTIKNKVPS